MIDEFIELAGYLSRRGRRRLRKLARSGLFVACFFALGLGAAQSLGGKTRADTSLPVPEGSGTVQFAGLADMQPLPQPYQPTHVGPLQANSETRRPPEYQSFAWFGPEFSLPAPVSR